MRFETKEGYDLTKEYEWDKRFYDNTKEIHAWLELAPPADVYKFLKENRQANPYGENILDDSCSPICESMLLRRNDALINTGLALFAESEDVCQFIYSHGDDRFKEFILSGPITSTVFYGHWFDDEIQLLVKDEKIDYLGCVVKNINTTDRFLQDFTERKGDWSDISVESWALLLMRFCENPKLRSYLPRFPRADYDYSAMLKAVWALFESINLETLGDLNRTRVLHALRELAYNLRLAMLSTPFGFTSAGPGFNVSNVCEKWKSLIFSDEDCQWCADEVLEILKWLADNDDSEKFRQRYIEKLNCNDEDSDVVPFTRELERKFIANMESSDENLMEIKSEVWKLEASLRDLFIDLRKHQERDETSKTWIRFSLGIIAILLLYIALS